MPWKQNFWIPTNLDFSIMAEKRKKIDMYDFLSMSAPRKISNNFHRKRFTFIGPVLLVHSLLIALRFKKVAHTFLPSFDNGNGSLCLKILWRSRHFATMVTWRHSFSLSKHVDQLKLRNYIQSLRDWGRAKHIVVSIVKKVISFTIPER